MAKLLESYRRQIFNLGYRHLKMAAKNEAPISEDIGGMYVKCKSINKWYLKCLIKLKIEKQSFSTQEHNLK